MRLTRRFIVLMLLLVIAVAFQQANPSLISGVSQEANSSSYAEQESMTTTHTSRTIQTTYQTSTTAETASTMVTPAQIAGWPVSPGAPYVNTDQSTYAQGESISYSGSGFTANGSIATCLSTDNDGTLQCATEPNADQFGNVSGTMYVGVNIPIGQQKFYAQDLATSEFSNAVQLTIMQYSVCTYANPNSIGATLLLDGNAYKDAQVAPILVGPSYSLQAQVPTGYSFAGWTVTRGTVNVTDSSSPNTTVTFGSGGWDGTCVGNLAVNYYPQILVTSDPTTGSDFIIVDGVAQDTPYLVAWEPDSTHTISANSQVSCDSGCQYVWTSWSDSGGQSHVITVPSVPTGYTAYFETQYQLMISLNGHGIGSPSSGNWYDSGSIVPITIGSDTSSNSSNTRYLYNGTAGTGSGSYTGSSIQFSVNMNSPVTETISWQTQYTLNIVLNGRGTSAPASGNWYDSESDVQVMIESDSSSNSSTTRYLYDGATGSGDGSYAGPSNPFSVTMNAPVTESAAWKTQYYVTITDSGVGSDTGSAAIVTVNDVSYQQSQLPYAAWFDASAFSYSYESPVSGSGERYGWASTSGLGQSLQSNTFTLGSAGTLTGAYNTQYQLTMVASPPGGGTTTPAVGTSWQNAGALVVLGETPSAGFVFSSWTCTGGGCYSGTSINPSITLNNTMTETANFNSIQAVTISTSLNATSILAGWAVHDSATLSGATGTAGGTVTYSYYSGGACSGTGTVVGSPVTVTGGVVPNSTAQSFSSAGSYSWNAVYSGDSNNSGATSACEPLTVDPSTGTIVIQKSAVGGDAQFNFTATGTGLPANFNFTTTSGSGSKTFSSLSPGSYSLTELGPSSPWGFTSLTCSTGGSVSGQTATISLTAGSTVTCTFIDTKVTLGLLRVYSTPAVPTTIFVNDIARDDWGLNWVKLAPGTYTVHFSDVPGFATPTNQTVVVTAGETTIVQGMFTQLGYLHVSTNPAVMATISVDGTPRNDWGAWFPLMPGPHTVHFGDVAGYATPADQQVTVVAGSTVAATGNYLAGSNPGPTGYGMLRVTTNPAVVSSIYVNNILLNDWGLDWVKLAPGTYTIHFADVPGFATPANQTVTVTAGQTTTVTGNFVQLGYLHVVANPALAATVSIDGMVRDDWGVWVPLMPGQHTVHFGGVAGYTAPADQDVAVAAGTTVTVTGNYT